MEEEKDFTIQELEAMAMNDESWEEDPQMRAMYVAVLHSFIAGA